MTIFNIVLVNIQSLQGFIAWLDKLILEQIIKPVQTSSLASDKIFRRSTVSSCVSANWEISYYIERKTDQKTTKEKWILGTSANTIAPESSILFLPSDSACKVLFERKA